MNKNRVPSAASLVVASLFLGVLTITSGCGDKNAEETSASPAAPAAAPANVPAGAGAARPAPNQDAAANAAAFNAAREKAEGK